MSELADSGDGWLAKIAAFDLPGARGAGAMPGSINDVLRGASEQRLTGVLAAAVDADALDLTLDDRAELARAHEGSMREALLLEEVLLEAIGVLGEVGVDYRVLKGTALAHMVHADPADRCFGDNDVLVRSADVDGAVNALVAAGAVRGVPPLSTSFDRRFAKSVTLGWTGPSELDLHRTLAAGPYGFLIGLDDLFRDPAELLLAGRGVRTLSADLHLVHGAIHVALGDVEARLGNVRDLALLAVRPSVDPESVRETAERWGCTAPLAVGLRATAALGHDRSELERWADDYGISDVDRRRLSVYRERAGRYRRQARASWRVLGWRDRVAFTRALVMPSPANRAERARSRTP